MFVNEVHKKADEELKAGNLKEALALYSQALVTAPNNPDIIADRGVVYLHLNDEKRCFEDFNLALELQPKKAYRYASRAYAKKHFKDLKGAVTDYEIAVSLDPEDAVAQNNLGLLLEELGYQQQAEERFKRADSLSKDEDKLLDAMNELEGSTSEREEQSNNDEMENTNDPTVGKEMKKVFTSKRQFKEFIAFIKNGFKLK